MSLNLLSEVFLYVEVPDMHKGNESKENPTRPMKLDRQHMLINANKVTISSVNDCCRYKCYHLITSLLQQIKIKQTGLHVREKLNKKQP